MHKVLHSVEEYSLLLGGHFSADKLPLFPQNYETIIIETKLLVLRVPNVLLLARTDVSDDKQLTAGDFSANQSQALKLDLDSEAWQQLEIELWLSQLEPIKVENE